MRIPSYNFIYTNELTNDGPFAVNGYYPLYSTAKAAVRASPNPLEVRGGESTVGYHIHILEDSKYYMPNGLVMNETQFHGNYPFLTKEDEYFDPNIEISESPRLNEIEYEEDGFYYDSRGEPVGAVPLASTTTYPPRDSPPMGIPSWPTFGVDGCRGSFLGPDQHDPNDKDGVNPKMRPFTRPDERGLPDYPRKPDGSPDWKKFPSACPDSGGKRDGGYPIKNPLGTPPYGGEWKPGMKDFDKEAEKEYEYWKKKLEELRDQYGYHDLFRYFIDGDLLYYILFDPILRVYFIDLMQAIDRQGINKSISLLWQIVMYLMYHPKYKGKVRRLWETILKYWRDLGVPDFFWPDDLYWPSKNTPKPDDWPQGVPWPPKVEPKLIDIEDCIEDNEEAPDLIVPPLDERYHPYDYHFTDPTLCPDRWLMRGGVGINGR